LKIIQILKKLGILRFGVVTGPYTRAEEIPDGLLMEDVYDSTSDMISERKPAAKQEPDI